MKNLAKNALKALAALSLPVLLSGAAAAQQVICFSFDGVKNTSNKDTAGGRSKTGIRIGGHDSVFIDVKAGTSPSGCADALQKELAAKGFKATKVGKNVVCVSAGPKGVPLTQGGGIGTTDTGLQGIDCKVMKPAKNPPPPNKPTKKKPVKGYGVAFPWPKPNCVASKDGFIQIDVEVLRWQNGKQALVTVQVQVKVTKGDKTDDVKKKIDQALRKAGLLPRSISYPSVLDPKQMLPCCAIDFDNQGNTVHHCTFLPFLDWYFYPVLEVQAGIFDGGFGCYPFGLGTQWQYPGQPFLHTEGLPALGQNLFAFVDGGTPKSNVFLLTGFDPFSWHFLFPGGELLVDPTNGFLLPMPPMDPLGHSQLKFPIPPVPALAGIELMSQSLVVDPKGGLALTNGLKTTVAPKIR